MGPDEISGFNAAIHVPAVNGCFGSFAAGRWKCFAVRSQPKTDGIAKIGERQLKAADIQWAQGNLMQAEHLCHRAGYGRESATD